MRKKKKNKKTLALAVEGCSSPSSRSLMWSALAKDSAASLSSPSLRNSTAMLLTQAAVSSGEYWPPVSRALCRLTTSYWPDSF